MEASPRIIEEMSKVRISIVVSHCEENVGWISEYIGKDYSIKDITVYSKCGNEVEGLEELEDLVTKFLKYRLDATNLLTYLRNSTKYEAPDLREVILNRFAKDADAVLDDEAMLDFNQEDLTNLMQKQPVCPAKKVVDVLIRWSRKRQK